MLHNNDQVEWNISDLQVEQLRGRTNKPNRRTWGHGCAARVQANLDNYSWARELDIWVPISSDESRDLFFESRSREFPVSKATSLHTLNIAKKVCKLQSLEKFLKFNDFLYVAFASEKQREQIEKMPEIWTKFNSEVMIFKKNSAKWTNHCHVSVSNFESRSHELLMKSRSRRSWSRLHHSRFGW